ncbi:energy transducer TonB [Cribrihabitans pelagius]|uniref:energy transducer TonB n=1 Tax=Cribrihabitans pelagius TaxID=1765746 RepID=UPI003B5AB288
MQTGTKISVAGHAVLVGWAVFGAWFPSEPLPFKVQEVALISSQEFERLSQQRQAPEISEAPAALAEPDSSADAPAPAPQEDARPDPVTPEPVAPVEPDPQVSARPQLRPEPQVPETLPAVPDAPESTALVPDVAPEAQQRPVDRVAPQPVAPPEPDTEVADVPREEVAPDQGAETEREVQEAAAPEAAADRIVTEENEGEAEVASAAPEVSRRPKTRPSRPRDAEPEPEAAAAAAPQAEEKPEPEPKPEPKPAAKPEPEEKPAAPEQVESAAVEDALAEALAGGQEADVTAPEPAGPPLTLGEKDALRVEVSRCWNVGSLSTDALQTTVVVTVSLAQNGTPDTGSIKMLSSSGGSAAAAKQAYEAARRAIIRCGAQGFSLPPEKYAQWRDIEMTFNPERMRIK